MATDMVALFIGDMEYIRLQQHLKPFFNVCSKNIEKSLKKFARTKEG